MGLFQIVVCVTDAEPRLMMIMMMDETKKISLKIIDGSLIIKQRGSRVVKRKDASGNL